EGIGKLQLRAFVRRVPLRTNLPRLPFSLGSYSKVALGIALTVIGTAFLHPYVPARLLFFVPVILIASRSGIGPAVFGSLLALLTYDYYFSPPIGELNFDVNQLISAVVLLATAIIATFMANAARRGEAAARQAQLARESDDLK